MFLGGVVEWSGGEEVEAKWAALDEARQDAAGAPGRVCRFPFIPGLFDAVVRSSGTGNGRDSYLRYAIDAGPGGSIWVLLDRREAKGRQLYNLRIRVAGTACLLVGAEKALGLARRAVEWLGGRIVDEWVREVHVCLDLPGVPVAAFVEPFKAGRFLTTAKKWGAHDGADGCTGFTVGRNDRRAVVLNVYDKLADIATNHDGVYERAYLDRRCGGERPEAATRVEYKCGRDWLKERGIDTVADLFEQLPELVSKLTAAGDDSAWPLFRLTQDAPNRGNKNQGRAGTDRLWVAVVEEFRRQVGTPHGRLGRIDRERISHGAALRAIIGYGTRIAAERDRYVETIADVAEVLMDVWESTAPEDEGYVARKWEQNARRAGTLHRVMEFDPHKLDPTGILRRGREELFEVAGEMVGVPF